MSVPVPDRSTFVTVLSWILIVSSGFTVFTNIIQLIVILGFARIHPAMRLMALLTGISLPINLGVLYAAWSLLNRKDWARKFYVISFSIGALCSVVVSVTVVGFLSAPEAQALPNSLYAIAVVPLAVGAVFAWLTRRLRSADVRAEFA